ncbi:MAG: MIP/aquaporin family protein [Nitrososphaerales archaeon]
MTLIYPCSACKKECFSELLGTYLLVLIGPASVITVSLIPELDSFAALLFVASAFGGVVAVAIFLLGKYSGAVINPALTLAVVIGKVVRSKFFIPYLVFQMSGALLAGLTSLDLWCDSEKRESGIDGAREGDISHSRDRLRSHRDFCSCKLRSDSSTRIKRAHNQAFLVGATLFVLIFLLGPLTGAGLNPARTIGPALASGYTENLYVYFVGPIVGAVLAGLLFRLTRNGRAKGNLVCMC